MKRTWKCEECGTTVEWSYDDLVGRGGPVCTDCDMDMVCMPEETPPGKWYVAEDTGDGTVCVGVEARDICRMEMAFGDATKNANLIVAAITMLPTIVDRIKSIANFSDSEDSIERVMNFRWGCVDEARELLGTLSPWWTPEE